MSMEVETIKICPVCGETYKRLNRHLIATHGWRYTESSPFDPVSKEADDRGHAEQRAKVESYVRDIETDAVRRFAEKVKALAWDADRQSPMWSEKSRKALLAIDRLCDDAIAVRNPREV